jgi:hypothetical protein
MDDYLEQKASQLYNKLFGGYLHYFFSSHYKDRIMGIIKNTLNDVKENYEKS